MPSTPTKIAGSQAAWRNVGFRRASSDGANQLGIWSVRLKLRNSWEALRYWFQIRTAKTPPLSITPLIMPVSDWAMCRIMNSSCRRSFW